MSDRVREIVTSAVDRVLASKEYDPHHVPRWMFVARFILLSLQAKKWTAQCLDQIVKELADSQEAFKYVVNCVIMQKTGDSLSNADIQTDRVCLIGAGLHTGMSCYWDHSTDGSQTVRWENKSMYCLCTVFGVTF